LLPHHPSLRSQRRGLAFLSQFAADVRYPGDHASKRQAAAALRWAGKVRATPAATSSARDAASTRNLSAIPLANKVGQRLNLLKPFENRHLHRRVLAVVPLSIV
jgi:hypothetical protein